MKQRLVGTLVLGALALILIPLLLDGEGVEAPPMTTRIPPAPVIDRTPVPEPLRPVIRSDAPAAEPVPEPEAIPDVALDETVPAAVPAAEPVIAPDPDATAPAADAPAVAAEELPRLDAQGLPEAWTVRLGSFGERRNAEALQERLIGAGHKAYLRPLRSAQGTLTGVYVGPLLTRVEANRLQAQLALTFDMNGIVERFTVESPPTP